MSSSSSPWTNPLSLILIVLGLVWIFTLAKSCTDEPEPGTTTQAVPSPIPNYEKLQETNCPLKLSQGDEALANALLQQYFRIDTLNRFQEAVWRPDPKLDAIFAQVYEGDWETYVECIQTLRQTANQPTEKMAIIVSNFADNDCTNCAPWVGYIRFSMQQNDLSTVVIQDSERAQLAFGAYGAVGDQISLLDLGAQQAMAFSTASIGSGLTTTSTDIYAIDDDFQPLLSFNRYESNGGTDETNLYERERELYYQAVSTPNKPVRLALYERTSILSGNGVKPPAPVITYYEYHTDSLRYIETR